MQTLCAPTCRPHTTRRSRCSKTGSCGGWRRCVRACTSYLVAAYYYDTMTCSLLCVNRGRGLRQHNIFDVSAVTVAACQQGQSAVPGLKPQDYIRRVVIILQLAPVKTCLTRMQSRRRTEYQYYMRAKSSVTVRTETLASLSTYSLQCSCRVLFC